jgi:acetoin utilization deacetylase AcuC-like enzyme
MPRTAIAADPGVTKHETGSGHPEQPARFLAVRDRLASSGLLEKAVQLPARSATDDELALVHPRGYVELVDREVAQKRRQLSTGDTAIGPHSAAVARLAVGCALVAVDSVFTKTSENAFSVARPPGHHASSARGMGFCLFNSIAVAARYAQAKYGAERIAIADWDVHHGNGTQDIFYADGSVLFFSTHQSPWYPGTGSDREQGEGPGLGKTINCPFPAGSGRQEILGAFQQHFVPAVHDFRPDLLLISAGFDSRAGDPLGQFLLSDQDFTDLTALMKELASRYCEERLVSVLEGGYSLEGLANAAEAHVRELQR